ncbi:MAG: nucleoside recognition protein, partial [Deltaproteobacteria bacterium]|nr:nucleoside recognition protein [Deltaproteobacteria bacterium]
SNFTNQLPAFFLHLPTTFFIVIPLTGLAGALYFLITFIAVVFRTILFLICGRFWLPRPQPDNVRPQSDNVRPQSDNVRPQPDNVRPQSEETEEIQTSSRKMEFNKKQIWDRLKSRLPGRISRIAVYVVPIYTLVFLLNNLGLFAWLREELAGYVVTTFMPMESLSVVILSFAAEFTSGFAAAGALLDAGVLTVKQTVLALLIGNVLAFPIRALRHQLPRYIGIFSPKMGTQLLLMGQGFRVTSIILMGVLYYFVG